MDKLFYSSEKIGDIVARFPKAGEIFTEYAIDFCCGGHRSLSEAIREQSLNEKELLDRLAKSYQDTRDHDRRYIDWRQAPTLKLIDHILNTHHVYMRRELPQLSDLVTTILRVHGASHGEVLSKVHRLFHNLKIEIDQHLIKEEEIVFPLIRDNVENTTSSQLKRIVDMNFELMKEHDGAGNVLKELRKVTNQYNVPEDGCSTYMKTYDKLVDLESNLFQHIHLENNILFPRLEELMNARAE
jgi:regulator of cell morphogenesis and NO signaling